MDQGRDYREGVLRLRFSSEHRYLSDLVAENLKRKYFRSRPKLHFNMKAKLENDVHMDLKSSKIIPRELQYETNMDPKGCPGGLQATLGR